MARILRKPLQAVYLACRLPFFVAQTAVPDGHRHNAGRGIGVYSGGDVLCRGVSVACVRL